jgi:hypothetical protein
MVRGMSLTRTVPSGVPSLRWGSPFAENQSAPPATPALNGPLEAVPGRMSLNSEVPAAVPSLDHSSCPCCAS